MTCLELEPWIAAYADGELDARRGEIVEEHLAECAGCTSLLAAFTTLAATLRDGLETVEAPAALHVRVMAALPEPEAVAPRRTGMTPPRGWFAFFSLAPAAVFATWLLLASPVSVSDTPSSYAVAENAGTPASDGARGGQSAEKPSVGRKTTRTESGGRRPGAGVRPATLGAKRVKSPSRPKAAPGTSVTPENDPVRRLLQLRPRRYQEFLVETPLRRSPGRRGGRVRLANDGGWSRQVRDDRTPPRRPRSASHSEPRHEKKPKDPGESLWMPDTAPQITVVDYVLPLVQPQPSGLSEEGETRATDAVQITQAVFEF
jgi:hypothetical protein